MPVTPIFDQLWSSTNVCVWDVAAAHLCHEDALRRIPEESSGKPFLVTGKGPAWRLRDTRAAVKVCLAHTYILTEVSTLILTITALCVSFISFHRSPTAGHIYPCPPG